MPLPPQRWTLIGLFLSVSLVSWLSAMAVDRMAAGFLALPEDAELVEFDGAAMPATAAADGDAAPDGPPTPSDPEAAAGDPGAVGADPEAVAAAERPGRANRPRAGARRGKAAYVDSIVGRNIFDSSKLGQSAASDAPISGESQVSDLKVVLIATVVAEPAEYSSALIADDSGTGALGYGINDDLLGEATIVAIEPRKVIIRRSDGSIEYISMDGEAPPPRPVGGAPTAAGDAAASAEGVSKTGDNKYTVDREVIDQLMANPEKLYSQVRVVPHKDANGEVDGYRLSGIRRNSFFYQLGVKNGDIVHTVNGQALTSMSQAMEAYNSLGSASAFTFDITRRNQRQTFEYDIR